MAKSSTPDKIGDCEEEDCSDCRDGDATKETNLSVEPKQFKHGLSNKGTDQTDDHVRQASETDTAGDCPCDPASQYADDDPGEQSSWFKSKHGLCLIIARQ
jgi:hypothetical protein